jgi:hypothetical protein
MGMMMHGSARLATLGLLALLFAAPAVSRADVVLFTNFGPSLGYDTGGGGPVGNAFDGNNYGEADSFLSSATDKLSSIDIALGCFYTGGCPDSFTVALDSNSGGHPGAALESFSVSGSGLGVFGNPNTPLVLTSVLMPTLTAGTEYWVSVTSDLNDSVVWGFNSTSDPLSQALSTDGGATWFAPSGQTPGALEVNGVTSTAPVIPEPPSVALLATGLLLAAVRFGWKPAIAATAR